MATLTEALWVWAIHDQQSGYCLFQALTIWCKSSNQSLSQHWSLDTQLLQYHRLEQPPLVYLWFDKVCWLSKQNPSAKLIFYMFVWQCYCCNTHCKFPGRGICFRILSQFLLPIFHYDGVCIGQQKYPSEFSSQQKYFNKLVHQNIQNVLITLQRLCTWIHLLKSHYFSCQK